MSPRNFFAELKRRNVCKVAVPLLTSTAILNEAYLRLVDKTKPVWQGPRRGFTGS